MADSVTEAVLYAFINQASSPDTGIHNPYFISKNPGYSYFFRIDGDRTRDFLCDSKGGVAFLQFGVVRDDNVESCNDTESFIDFVLTNLVGYYGTLEIYKVDVLSDRDAGTTNDMLEGIYHKQFDIELRWRIS